LSSSCLVANAVDQRPHGLHQVTGFAEGLVQRSRRLRPLRPWSDSARPVALSALGFQCSRRRPLKTGRAVTRRAHRHSGITLFKQGEMLTLLKCDERARVARAARSRKVASIDRAGRIRTVQEASVSEERLERGRIASVTPLTPHIVRLWSEWSQSDRWLAAGAPGFAK
jgi:hypothetical protein